MEKQRTAFLFLSLIFFTTFPASAAFLEIRGNAGGAFIDPHDYNVHLRNNGVKELYVFSHLGADAIFFPAPAPVGLGVRYEYNGIKLGPITKGDPNESELQAERWSGILTARFDQNTFYGGLLFTFGFRHYSKVIVKNATTTTTYDDNKAGFTYTIGFDSGLKLGPLRLGTEAGYQNYLIKEIKGPSGNGPFNVDLNGFYALVHAGLGF